MSNASGVSCLPIKKPIRTVIADDHTVTRFGIRSMLQQGGAVFEVVGEAENGEVAVMLTRELQPDLLLLDLQMPRLSGLEALRMIMLESPPVKTVFFTAKISRRQIIEALEIGARGVVLKDSAANELGDSLRAVLGGDYWIAGKRVFNPVSELHELMKTLASLPGRKTYGLTPREIGAVQCIIEGCSNRDIAKQFLISEVTVKRHLTNIYDKTGVSNRLELALFAISNRLIA